MATKRRTSKTLLNGLLTREQLAADLEVSTRTIIRFEDRGLPTIRLGIQRLYDPDAVREWIRKQ